jgi:hypothetical protein
MQYTMLENELRMAASRAQMRAVLPDRDPPRSPDPARAYNVSAEVRITQHLDTVFFARGCPSLGRVDTTVFLMLGEDSVRRVSRPERTFGKAMNLSLTNQMRMVLTRERIKARETPLPPDFPRAPVGCP